MSRLWYGQEASCWDEALPVGNGKLGAMVFGGVEKEHLQLNEETIWYGGPRNRRNPGALKNLKKVRELIYEEKIQQAEDLLRYHFSGIPQSQRPYQSLGDLWIQMREENAPADHYERELSLEEAYAGVSYQIGKKTYQRKYFVSFPGEVLVGEISACGEKISLEILLTRSRFYETVEGRGEDTLLLKGNLGEGGLDFRIGCRVCVQDGQVSRQGEHLLVKDAGKVVFYLAAGTAFRQIQEDHKEIPDGEIHLEMHEREAYVSRLEQEILEKINRAAAKGAGALWMEHLEDYRNLYHKVSLELSSDRKLDMLPTDVRLEKVRQGGTDVGLAKICFDLGRYLLISSSRQGTLPANLQGIWNESMEPSWDSKFTININTQMNYWPADRCGLGECQEPLFELLHRIMKNGKLTAREMYGCRGFVAHHNTDIWADTAPQDIYIPATYWVMGGAWLSTCIRTHYDYTRDAGWLSGKYDILEQSVLFFVDFLEKRDGIYWICPSVSPENTYIMEDGKQGRLCVSSAMDNQILRQLLEDYLYVTEELRGRDQISETAERKEILEKSREILDHLPEDKIGKYGQIMEWQKDYEEAEPGHRHISQLYGLHPGRQITVDDTPLLAEAAKKTLKRRLLYGGGHTGWSCAWLINLYARLMEGEEAWKMLQKYFQDSTTLNFLDTHPRKWGTVFQIDGNLGACAGILEMLVQSDEKRVILLPACPAAWDSGSIKGVRLHGNAVLDMEWEEGKVKRAVIKSFCPWERMLKWNGEQQRIQTGPEHIFRYSRQQ